MSRATGRGVKPVLGSLTRIMTQPREELTRFQRTLRFCFDLVRYGARQLQEGRAAQMAAALSFRVLFGLMPVLVVGTVVARSLMGPEDFKVLVHEVFEWMGMYNYIITLPKTEGGTGEQPVSLG